MMFTYHNDRRWHHQNNPPKSNVATMRLTPHVVEFRIQKIAKVTENVIFGNHARQRMGERDMTDVDVLRVLRTGSIEGWPEATERNEWKCKMVLKMRGGRTAGVITIILHGNKLFVKTVEWEDRS